MLFRDFRDAVGAKVARDGVIGVDVFNKIMNKPGKYTLTRDQLQSLVKAAPRDPDGKILLQQWCDVAYEKVIAVVLQAAADEPTSKGAEAEDAEGEAETLEQTMSRQQRRASLAKQFYSNDPPRARAYSTVDMGRAALGLPAVPRMPSHSSSTPSSPGMKHPQEGVSAANSIDELRNELRRRSVLKVNPASVANPPPGEHFRRASGRGEGGRGNLGESAREGRQDQLDEQGWADLTGPRDPAEPTRSAAGARKVRRAAGVDLAATAAAEKQNEAKAESAAQEDDAANRTPYLIGWFNNPSIARWAAILKRTSRSASPHTQALRSSAPRKSPWS